MSTDTQNAKILTHLKKGKSITFLEALNKFGVMHLPRRMVTPVSSGLFPDAEPQEWGWADG